MRSQPPAAGRDTWQHSMLPRISLTSSQGKLGILCHGVALIQNHQLVLVAAGNQVLSQTSVRQCSVASAHGLSAAYLNIVRVLTKSWICCRTMPIPLSSDALSSSTMLPMLAPYICRATARMVEVLPVPGGPYNSRCGKRFSWTSLLTAAMNSKLDDCMCSLQRSYRGLGPNWYRLSPCAQRPHRATSVGTSRPTEHHLPCCL